MHSSYCCLSVRMCLGVCGHKKMSSLSELEMLAAKFNATSKSEISYTCLTNKCHMKGCAKVSFSAV